MFGIHNLVLHLPAETLSMIINILYYSLCLLAMSAALAIFFTPSVFAAAIYLVGMILSLAALYCLQGAPLVAIMQIILHVGGILVLLVYLLFLNPEAIVPKKKPSPYRRIAYLGILLLPISIVGWKLAVFFLPCKLSQLAPWTHSPTTFSYQLVGSYGVVLELVGILLLITLVGISYILIKTPR
jgi:NADH-quinone oxidoreductase subunit J